MRMAKLAFLLVLVCCISVGCESCDPNNGNGNGNGDDTTTTTTTTTTSSTTCSGTTCGVVININEKCEPDPMSSSVDPGATMCFFNNGIDTITLSLPAGLVASSGGAPYTEYSLAPEQCVTVQVTSAAEMTHSYQITGCTTSGGAVGNPEVKVGGGGGG